MVGACSMPRTADKVIACPSCGADLAMIAEGQEQVTDTYGIHNQFYASALFVLAANNGFFVWIR